VLNCVVIELACGGSRWN